MKWKKGNAVGAKHNKVDQNYGQSDYHLIL